MRIDRGIFRLALRAGELLRLDAAVGIEVEVECGRLWITEESQARDTWLDAGQCARLEGRGLTILEATRNARIRIAESLQPMERMLR